MKALAADLKLERYCFSGPVYGAEKVQKYQEASLFVLPTYSENFGLTVAEALANGTPVVVTRGAPWAGLESHSCGWWIADDVDILTQTLDSAMSLGDDVREEMGLNGRSWIERDFTWRLVAAQMKVTYKWLVRGRRETRLGEVVICPC